MSLEGSAWLCQVQFGHWLQKWEKDVKGGLEPRSSSSCSVVITGWLKILGIQRRWVCSSIHAVNSSFFGQKFVAW